MGVKLTYISNLQGNFVHHHWGRILSLLSYPLRSLGKLKNHNIDKSYLLHRIIDSFQFILKKNYKIKTSFVIFIKSLKYDAIHDFSVLLRTGSNPADINRFLSHVGKLIIYLHLICLIF